MNIQKRAKLMVVAASAVALVGVGGAAFTATGLNTSGQAAAAQYVGGTVTQAVNGGGTLSNVAYGFTDGTKTAVNQVTLTFADATTDGRPVAITLTGGAGTAFTCENVGATTSAISTCVPTSAGTSNTGTTGISVTVS